MRGLLVTVHHEWLALVSRESPDIFALPRRDRTTPRWTAEGDPWFLAVAAPKPLVAAHGAYVDHELLTLAEGFERFGYGCGALTVEHLATQLSSDRDDLLGWVSLRDLHRLDQSGERELRELGVALPPLGDEMRLDGAQAAALLERG